MSHQFPPAVLEDIDGYTVQVTVSRIGGHHVSLYVASTTGGGETTNLDPGTARALARALDEAADEADLRALEELAR